jgi:hypothetical protein
MDNRMSTLTTRKKYQLIESYIIKYVGNLALNLFLESLYTSNIGSSTLVRSKNRLPAQYLWAIGGLDKNACPGKTLLIDPHAL